MGEINGEDGLVQIQREKRFCENEKGVSEVGNGCFMQLWAMRGMVMSDREWRVEG